MTLNQRLTFGIAAAFAGLAGLPISSAQAQVDEMIVTSQKRPESLEDVPLAVSAFDADFLEAVGFENIFDLQNYTPGLYFTQSQDTSQTTIYLRGIGTSGNNAGTEPSVGVFVDGIYRSRSSAAIFDLPDLERVEILRGPQGTLFGRNTSAGSISIVTQKPSYELGGTAELSYGNFDYFNAKGSVTGPIVQDKLAFRLAGVVTDRDGYIHNLHLDTDVNDLNRWGLRGQFLMNPTENFEARLILDYSEQNEKCCGAPAYVNGPSDAALMGVPLYAAFGLSSGDSPNVLSGDDFFDRDVSTNTDPISKAEDWGVSLEMDWDLGGVTLTSITGYRSYQALGEIDADFVDLNIIPLSSRKYGQSAISQEIRLHNDESERFEWVTGFYYFAQDFDLTEKVRFGEDANAYVELIYPTMVEGLLGLPAGSVSLTGGAGSAAILDLFTDQSGVNDYHQQNHRSWAFFAQGTYDITDKLKFTGGVRYTDEHKVLKSTFTEVVPNGGLSALVPITVTPPGINTAAPLGFNSFQPTSAVPDINETLDDQVVTGTAKMQYYWTPDVQTYASYSRGYKSGGTNVARVVNGNFLFDPETVNSFEIGLKGQFFDNRLRLNTAAYLAKYNDFQDVTFIGTGFLLQNAGKVSSKGVEIEATGVPTDWLTLESVLTWQDSEFKKFESGPCQAGETPNGVISGTCDRTGGDVPNTPHWLAHFAATVTQPITPRLTGFLRGDVTYRSKFMTDTNNDPRKEQDGYTTVDARAGVTLDDGHLEISVWGKNLTDAEWTYLAFDGVLQTGKLYAYPNEPRTYGITVKTSF